MFGYVRPYTPRLLVSEHETYKAAYCGVCRELGKLCGPIWRLTLSYDFVFVALFAAAVNGETPEIRNFRCGLNPFKKRKICENSESLRFAAVCALVLMYYKWADDRADKKGFGKLAAALGMSMLRGPMKKARAAYPAVAEAADGCVRRQQAVESDSAVSIDLAADPTGRALAAILTAATKDGEIKEKVSDFGYMLGRWVYLIDAADDLPRDKKRGAFNPFSAVDPERVKTALNLTLTEADNRWQKISSQIHHPIIDNIVMLGLPAVQTDVLANPGGRLKGKNNGKSV